MNRSLRPFAFLALAALAVRAPLLYLGAGQAPQLAGAAPAASFFGEAAPAGLSPLAPLAWLLGKGLGAARSLLGGPLGFWQRLPGLAGDILVSLSLYALVRRRRPGGDGLAAERAGLLAGLGWALNPLAILLCGLRGSFDSLALALLLAGVWWLEYSEAPLSEAWAALALAGALALHAWALAFLPLALGAFATPAERRRFAAWVLLPPLLLLLPRLWLDSPEDLAARLLAGGGELGITGALRAAFAAAGTSPERAATLELAWRGLALAGLLLAFATAWRRSAGWKLVEGLPWAALALAAFSPGLELENLVWAPALAFLLYPLLGWRLSLGGLALAGAAVAFSRPELLPGARTSASSLQLAWLLLLLAAWAWTLWEWSRLGLTATDPRDRA